MLHKGDSSPVCARVHQTGLNQTASPKSETKTSDLTHCCTHPTHMDADNEASQRGKEKTSLMTRNNNYNQYLYFNSESANEMTTCNVKGVTCNNECTENYDQPRLFSSKELM